MQAEMAVGLVSVQPPRREKRPRPVKTTPQTVSFVCKEGILLNFVCNRIFEILFEFDQDVLLHVATSIAVGKKSWPACENLEKNYARARSTPPELKKRAPKVGGEAAHF